MRSGTGGMKQRAGHGEAWIMERIGSTPRPRRFASLLAALLALVAVGTAVGAVPVQAEPMPVGVPGTWELRLNEEFTSAGLNTALWTPEWPGGDMNGQCTSPSLVSQPGNGYLYLQVRAQESTCGGTKHPDTGSTVESNPADGKPGHSGFLYSYGYVEWHVYIVGWGGEAQGCPRGGCIPDWPGLWSFPESEENEIDTLEGLHGKACHTWHHHVSPIEETQGCQSGSYAGWHTYGVDWEPGVLTFYYDGAKVGEVKTGYINSTPQYLIMTEVPPGSYGGELVVPDEIAVDYVRVWQHPHPTHSNAWAFARPNEELDAFFDGTNNVMHDWFAHPGWTLAEFSPASGYPAAAGYPSAFVRANGELNAYYRGTNNDIYQLFANTAWHVENLGCCSAGDPLAFERSNGELQVFFRGTNNGIYNDWWAPGGKWSSQRLEGTSEMLGKPSGFERANGEIQVFFRGTDNGIYNLWYSAGKWSLQRLGCCTAGNPVALERSNGEIDVLFRGTNNSIYDIWYSGGVWNGPAELATEAAGNPSAFERANGEIQMFFRARQTGAIWNGWAATGATKWSFQERGCCAAGDPSAFEQPSGALRVFFRGTNNAIYDIPYSGGTWYSPEYLGGEASEDTEY